MSTNQLSLRFSDWKESLLRNYWSGILNRAWWIVCLIVLLTALSLHYSITHLGFNTDTTEMLSPELPFHQDRIHFWETFPQDVKSILIVIDAPSSETATQVTKQLGTKLKSEQQLIESVYMPGDGTFFDEQALLYVDVKQLEQLLDNLSEAQPLLAKLAQNNSLEGFLNPLGSVLTDIDSPAKFDLQTLLQTVGAAFTDAAAGKSTAVSWQQLLIGKNPVLNNKRRFIIVKAKLDYSQIFPAQSALEAIHQYAQDIESALSGVNIRMTGETALQHEELQSVSQGSAISAIISLLLVCATLFIGLRSTRLILATLLTLITGLVLTAGFAALAIGHLNMISVAFAVLYIGLGVDYAIHLCLHFQEILNQGRSKPEALRTGIGMVAPALLLCAITSAVGFYSFIPTSYSGVSELGLISGTSMFIGLLLTLTFLPALLNLMQIAPLRINQAVAPQLDIATTSVASLWRSRLIRWIALILAVVSIFVLPEVTFDFDPVHLRDKDSESVITYNDLVADPNASPLTLTVLEPDRGRMLATVDQIRQLGSVDRILNIESFIPKNQDLKLELIDEMNLILGPIPQPFPGLSQNDEQQQAFNDFETAVDKAIELRKGTELEPELLALADRFKQFTQSQLYRDSEMPVLQLFERNLLTGLPTTIRLLQHALNAKTVLLEQLPQDLSERWLSADGIYRIQVFPKEDITQLKNLRVFVEDIQAIVPHATDLPVIYFEAGKEVVKAFQQALLTALAAILIVLLTVLRSIRDTTLVLFPLLLAAMLTGATSVFLNLPFNFANIIAVPLLFGLGVDSGIHIMHSIRNGCYYRSTGIMQNSTTRAIFFSALTTIFSFSSLAFSPHDGTASMGILLAIGIFYTLFCTLIVLPAFAVKFRP